MRAGVEDPIFGTQHVCSFTIPNAFQKIKMFSNPNRNWTIKYSDGNTNHQSTFSLSQGGTITLLWYDFIGFQYSSLKDLYVNGEAWIVGYYNSLGEWINCNYKIVFAQGWRDVFVWEILGRMGHLLQDMSVPAHANIDPHGDNPGLINDYYESYFGYDFYWNAQNVYSQFGGYIDPLQYQDPLHFLMYTTNQMANHFATQGPHKKYNNDYFGGDGTSAEIAYLNSLNVSQFGLPTSDNGPWNYDAKINVRNKMLPQAIRATAGLLYWFATEVGLITKITAKNNFDFGTIKVGINTYATQRESPFTFGTMLDQTVNLEAQNQTYNGYDRVWNNYGNSQSLSVWKKQTNNSPDPTPIYGAIQNYYNFTTSLNDHLATYIADLKKKYRVNTNYQTEFDGALVDQAITYIVEQNSGQISAPAQQTINGRLYNFFGWSDGAVENPRVITPTNNGTYTALYKLPHHSNQMDAFENSSARKFIKTSDGIMHHIYVSMSRVWYEQSTNNGATWIIMNDGLPIDNGVGKCPSIDFAMVNEHIFIILLFQEEGINSTSYLKAAVYKSAFGIQPYQLLETETVYSFMNPSNYQMRPVMGIDNLGAAVIAWEIAGDGLYYRAASIDANGLNLIGNNLLLQGTTGKSTIAAISASKFVNGSQVKHLIWEDEAEINYFTFNSSPPGTVTTISTSGGYSNNYSPSLVSLNDNIARICWIGERMDEAERMERNVVFTASDNFTHYWIFGNDVSSANINRPDDVNAYIIGWSENDGSVNKIVDNHLSQSYIKNLNFVGKDIQICNGSTFSNMYATTFSTSNSPYFFNLSNDIQSYYSIPKNTSTTSISEGREGIVAKNKLQFYFGVGDVKVDNELVSFKEIADSVRFSNLQTLNQYLTTEPFPLTDNSSFLYSVQFGVTDTSYAQNSLGEDSFVKYRVLLIDDNTNQLLGVYDEVTYTLENLLQHKNIAYQVNTAGIGNRTVRLALEVTDNITPKYALAEKYADDYVITKEKYETISFQGKLGVTEYALEQNYPNPFNPVTTIRYQIPKAGRVTLKVYDILGKEITTLVNEEKEIGRYQINFDASNLSSGVYLYEIVVNDYRAVKKLMVIK